jgi:hypothetical protein
MSNSSSVHTVLILAFTVTALSGCGGSGTGDVLRAMPQSVSQKPALLDPGSRRCPRKYTLGCVTLTPSGESETITFSCSGHRRCPVSKWTMENFFYTVKGKSARKDLTGHWDPNPYYSAPDTYTINLISELRALKPSKRVEYYVDLLACPNSSNCKDLGTVGIIPEF